MKIELTIFRVIMTSIFTMLILVSIWLYLLFSASPGPYIDYMAEYNKYSMPDNYQEELNAIPFYKQAASLATDKPDELDQYFNADKNGFQSPSQQQLDIMEQWLAKNDSALVSLRQAVSMPFCYNKFLDKNGNIELKAIEIVDLIYLLVTDCIASVERDNIDRAISALNSISVICQHFSRKNTTLIEQMVGIGVCRERWQKAAYYLVTKKQINVEQTKKLREIVDRTVNTPVAVSYDCEKMLRLININNLFVDKKNGSGRQAWKCRWGTTTPDYTKPDVWLQELHNFAICAFGQTKKQITHNLERIFELYSQAAEMTPWQLKHDTSGIMSEAESLRSAVMINIFDNIDYQYKNYSYILALQVNLAIKEFQLTHNRLPQTLAELVEKQYLKAVPLDLFSDGELVYKIDRDSYLLYSFGENFLDDSGSRALDIVFWPPPDIEKMNLSGPQTVLAINKFKQTNSRLPQSLGELVEKQYLSEIPLDQFSNAALTYKIKGDSFVLYSYGKNLYDDGGNPEKDMVFWPLPKPEPQQADIDTEVEPEPDAESEK